MLAVVIYIIVVAFLIAVILTKRPHNPWMKTGMTILFAGFGVWSVYGMAHRNEGVAIFFAVVLGTLLVWRTFKGWNDWWAKL